MHRRKFSYKGKPHGRNELIKEYIWIAYLQSLPHGAKPDESMRRTRKQVSSHIQVLKGFLKGHPACKLSFCNLDLYSLVVVDSLFPKKKDPENGFEDSFKNDPCLRALTEGRLPTTRSTHYEEVLNKKADPIRPTLFWLLITTQPVPDELERNFSTEQDLRNIGLVAHKFSGLSAQKSRCSLDTITNWPQKFPALDHLQMAGDLNCDIIQMDVSLNLMTSHPAEKSELCCRTEMSLPGRSFEKSEWRIVTTFVKPQELCGDPSDDPPLNNVEFQVAVVFSSDQETRIKVPFPAKAWASAFTQLIHLQTRYDEKRRAQAMGTDNGPPPKSVREYVDSLCMYQEIRSRVGPRADFIRRAIILWTFRKAKHGEGNHTNWRYLDPLPPRRTCMSPSPHPSHAVTASMNESFNSWTEPSLSIHHSNLLDPFGPGLVTPPHTAGIHSSFPSQSYAYNTMPFGMPTENLSFVSSKTADSESTLVENDVASNIDQFFSNSTVHLTDYDHNSGNWPPAGESFEDDPAWATYTVPTSTPHVTWDSPTKLPAWSGPSDNKLSSWADESSKHHDWAVEPTVSPSKQPNYLEQAIEQRLVPWAEHHDGPAAEIKNSYPSINEQIPSNVATNSRVYAHEPIPRNVITIGSDYSDIDDQQARHAGANGESRVNKGEWDDTGDDFDYSELGDRLKR